MKLATVILQIQRQVVIYFESTRFLVSLESEVQLTCWLAYVICKFGPRL